MRAPEADRKHWRTFRLAYAIWIFGVFAYFVPAATWSPVSRFDLTRALVERQSLRIDAWAENTGDRALREGHWYSDKAPIPSLLAVPSYALFHELQADDAARPEFVSLSTADSPARTVVVNGAFSRAVYFCSITTAALAGVAIALLTFEWLRRKTSAGAAFFGSLTATLATPIFPYSTSFYGHVLAGAFLLFAFTVFESSTSTRSARRFASAALVLAAGCEYIVAVPAALIGAWVIVRAFREKDVRATLLDLAAGALAPIVVIGAYQAACFGSPLRTGYSFIARPEFAAGHASGLLGIHLPRLGALAGLLVGGRRGLFFVAPVTLVACVAIGARIARSRQVDECVAAAAMILLLLINAGYYMWWGGAATGPRHLVPVLSFVSLGCALAWEKPAWRPWLVVIAVVSFANMLALTAVGLEAPETGNVLFDYAWPRLLARKIAHLHGASNLGVQLGFARATSLVPLFTWLVLGLRYFVGRLRAGMPAPTPTPTPTKEATTTRAPDSA